jgi:hypothetical protein
VVRNCGFSETFFFVVCDDIWITIYPSFVVVSLPKSAQVSEGKFPREKNEVTLD